MANTLGKYNPFRYRGYVYDEETGLYYLNSRYYDPEHQVDDIFNNAAKKVADMDNRHNIQYRKKFITKVYSERNAALQYTALNYIGKNMAGAFAAKGFNYFAMGIWADIK